MDVERMFEYYMFAKFGSIWVRRPVDNPIAPSTVHTRPQPAPVHSPVITSPTTRTQVEE